MPVPCLHIKRLLPHNTASQQPLLAAFGSSAAFTKGADACGGACTTKGVWKRTLGDGVCKREAGEAAKIAKDKQQQSQTQLSQAEI